MSSARQRVVYLHGFNSSPASHKARLFTDYCRSKGVHDLVAPALSHDPARAMQTIYECIGDTGADVALMVGSSLGGYYATFLAERHGFKAALINPAVAPCDNMQREFIGRHRNYYTQEEYEFTAEHVAFLRTLNVERIRDPALYLLLVQAGDEVLDYRLAVKLYAGCRQVVQQGGSHGFDNFEAVLPLILQFAGLQDQ
ncbi:MAG: hypothetical protein RLZZ227_990 [Pseudomonadota bacterium]|jgi:predicted esterase YcpF (UPF0227 family)